MYKKRIKTKTVYIDFKSLIFDVQNRTFDVQKWCFDVQKWDTIINIINNNIKPRNIWKK